MNVNEELAKIEAELKIVQERFLILTGAKQAFEMILKSKPNEDLESPALDEPTQKEHPNGT